MKAMTLTRPKTLVMAEIDEPNPGTGALVAPEIVGICGTDMKIYSGGIPVDYPRIMGHEIIARVVHPAAGSSIAADARVLVDPGVACGECRLCRAGRSNLCLQGALMGREMDGALTEVMAVDERLVHPLPPDIGLRAASLLQVLGTCVHAQSHVADAPEGVAVVIGLGVAGLLHVQLLRAQGRRVVGITRSAHKREMAARFGAEAVGAPAEATALVSETSGGEGAALVVEAVGSVASLALAIDLAAPGASILQYGNITETTAPERFPWYQLFFKEIKLAHPRAALGADYDTAIAMAGEGTVSLEPLWSRSFPFDRTADAFAHLGSSPGDFKVTIEI